MKFLSQLTLYIRQNMQSISSNKLTALLVGALILILLGGVSYLAFFSKPKDVVLEEFELPFDPEGPYALLLPRRDGNAINLNIKRVSQYDAFSYELVYSAEGIDRGAGDPKTFIDLKDQKGEYSQEILFGTCSKGDTSDPLHCVFDKGVENGTLTLRFRKENKLYRMLMTWHLQKPDVAEGEITSGDAHFLYKSKASKQDLLVAAYSIVNNLSGAPKLPEGKKIQGEVYAFNLPVGKEFSEGDVSIELAENPPSDAKIARYEEGKNAWELLDTKVTENMLTAKASGAGIFAVLVNSQE